MALEDLNEKLYARDFHAKATHTDYSEHADVKPEVFAGADWQKEEAVSLVAADASEAKKKKSLMIGGVIAVVFLLVSLAFFIHSKLFDDVRVTIGVDGPKSVAAAETVRFFVSYSNNNWLGLKDAEIVLAYPDGFRPESDGKWRISGREAILPIGEIEARSTGQVSISGKFFSAEGTLNYLDAKLQYEPKGVDGVLSSENKFGVNVSTSPLSLEVTVPLEAATGNTVEYLIDYGNESDEEFSNVRIKASYSDDFQFTSSDPSPSEGSDTWYVGDVASKVGGKIRIKGILSGKRDDARNFSASIGYVEGNGNFLAYTSRNRTTKITSAPLIVSQSVNGSLKNTSADLGNELHYQISYRNESEQGFRDAIVTVEFDTNILDFSEIRKDNGYFNADEKRLIWKASDIKSLSVLDPGESGMITFSVPIMRSYIQKTGTHLGVRTVARVDSPDIPTPAGSSKVVASDTMLVRLNSSIDFEVKGKYYDGPIWNSGPVPPEVGVQTLYNLTFRLSSALNDLTNAKIVATLPSGVRYTDKYVPDTEAVTFNSRSNELVWDIGAYSASSDAVVREMTVQVAILPGPDQKDQEVKLLNKAVFSAKDTFVGSEIKKEVGAKTTALPEDEKIQGGGYKVKK